MYFTIIIYRMVITCDGIDVLYLLYLLIL